MAAALGGCPLLLRHPSRLGRRFNAVLALRRATARTVISFARSVSFLALCATLTMPTCANAQSPLCPTTFSSSTVFPSFDNSTISFETPWHDGQPTIPLTDPTLPPTRWYVLRSDADGNGTAVVVPAGTSCPIWSLPCATEPGLTSLLVFDAIGVGSGGYAMFSIRGQRNAIVVENNKVFTDTDITFDAMRPVNVSLQTTIYESAGFTLIFRCVRAAPCPYAGLQPQPFVVNDVGHWGFSDVITVPARSPTACTVSFASPACGRQLELDVVDPAMIGIVVYGSSNATPKEWQWSVLGVPPVGFYTFPMIQLPPSALSSFDVVFVFTTLPYRASYQVNISWNCTAVSRSCHSTSNAPSTTVDVLNASFGTFVTDVDGPGPTLTAGGFTCHVVVACPRVADVVVVRDLTFSLFEWGVLQFSTPRRNRPLTNYVGGLPPFVFEQPMNLSYTATVYSNLGGGTFTYGCVTPVDVCDELVSPRVFNASTTVTTISEPETDTLILASARGEPRRAYYVTARIGARPMPSTYPFVVPTRCAMVLPRRSLACDPSESVAIFTSADAIRDPVDMNIVSLNTTLPPGPQGFYYIPQEIALFRNNSDAAMRLLLVTSETGGAAYLNVSLVCTGMREGNKGDVVQASAGVFLSDVDGAGPTPFPSFGGTVQNMVVNCPVASSVVVIDTLVAPMYYSTLTMNDSARTLTITGYKVVPTGMVFFSPLWIEISWEGLTIFDGVTVYYHCVKPVCPIPLSRLALPGADRAFRAPMPLNASWPFDLSGNALNQTMTTTRNETTTAGDGNLPLLASDAAYLDPVLSSAPWIGAATSAGVDPLATRWWTASPTVRGRAFHCVASVPPLTCAKGYRLVAAVNSDALWPYFAVDVATWYVVERSGGGGNGSEVDRSTSTPSPTYANRVLQVIPLSAAPSPASGSGASPSGPQPPSAPHVGFDLHLSWIPTAASAASFPQLDVSYGCHMINIEAPPPATASAAVPVTGTLYLGSYGAAADSGSSHAGGDATSNFSANYGLVVSDADGHGASDVLAPATTATVPVDCRPAIMVGTSPPSPLTQTSSPRIAVLHSWTGPNDWTVEFTMQSTDGATLAPPAAFTGAANIAYAKPLMLLAAANFSASAYQGPAAGATALVFCCDNATLHSSDCSACQVGRWGFPRCRATCDLRLDCGVGAVSVEAAVGNNNGSAEAPGACRCTCGARWTGPLCDRCARWPSEYPSCEPCLRHNKPYSRWCAAMFVATRTRTHSSVVAAPTSSDIGPSTSALFYRPSTDTTSPSATTFPSYSSRPTTVAPLSTTRSALFPSSMPTAPNGTTVGYHVGPSASSTRRATRRNATRSATFVPAVAAVVPPLGRAVATTTSLTAAISGALLNPVLGAQGLTGRFLLIVSDCAQDLDSLRDTPWVTLPAQPPIDSGPYGAAAGGTLVAAIVFVAFVAAAAALWLSSQPKPAMDTCPMNRLVRAATFVWQAAAAYFTPQSANVAAGVISTMWEHPPTAAFFPPATSTEVGVCVASLAASLAANIVLPSMALTVSADARTHFAQDRAGGATVSEEQRRESIALTLATPFIAGVRDVRRRACRLVFAVDLGISTLVALMAGFQPVTVAGCRAVSAACLILQFIWLAYLVRVHPLDSRLEHTIVVFNAAATAVVAAGCFGQLFSSDVKVQYWCGIVLNYTVSAQSVEMIVVVVGLTVRDFITRMRAAGRHGAKEAGTAASGDATQAASGRDEEMHGAASVGSVPLLCHPVVPSDNTAATDAGGGNGRGRGGDGGATTTYHHGPPPAAERRNPLLVVPPAGGLTALKGPKR